MTALRDFVAGRMPAATVPSLRLEGFGMETYAREPIAALFARYPERFDDSVTIAGQSAACMASLAANDAALFADLHAGTIVRLWRLGAPVDGAPPPHRVAVAADHDLTQLRGATLFDSRDYPDLTDPGAVAAAATAASALDFGLDQPPLRTHVFVRRAFTAGGASAALFGMVVLASGARRQPLAFNVAALCYPGSVARLIIDRAGLAAAQASTWIPHL